MNMMNMGMNPGMMPMYMNTMGMNNMMMPNMMQNMMMNNQKKPMTEEQKKQLRLQGYLMGKKMAEERKKKQAPQQAPVVEEGPVTGEITVKFKKGGSVTNIKMDAGSMVAELLNEYFEKAHVTSGTFTHNGQALSPTDTSTLSEAGFKNNSEVTVT